VDSTEFMNLCYSSADVFVLPTLADNLPLTLLEALAAGTPSVAFDTGGVPEVVRHMETGYLCRYKDSEDLARGIRTLLMNANLMASMRPRCRDVATKEYAREVQARRYMEVYERAVNLRRQAPGTDASASD
jgi:glycosyltransferase involved in cell wall biosynthesis